MDLNQILEQVTQTKEQHNAAVEVAAQELANVRQLIEEARAAAEAAAAAGDHDAYASEKRREDYNRARAKALEHKTITPAYTEEQYSEITLQAYKQALAEVAPMYNRLHEICGEWDEICAQIKEKSNCLGRINNVMQNTVGYEVYRQYSCRHPDSVGFLRMKEAIDYYVRDHIESFCEKHKDG